MTPLFVTSSSITCEIIRKGSQPRLASLPVCLLIVMSWSTQTCNNHVQAYGRTRTAKLHGRDARPVNSFYQVPMFEDHFRVAPLWCRVCSTSHSWRDRHIFRPPEIPASTHEEAEYPLDYNCLASSEGLPCSAWLHHISQDRVKNAVRERPLRMAMYTVDTGHSVGFHPLVAPSPWGGTGPAVPSRYRSVFHA